MSSHSLTPTFPLLVSVQRLLILKDQVQIIDARDADYFEKGHIPGAVHLPPALFERDEPVSSGILVRRQLQSLETVAKKMGDAGIRSDVPIIIYDQGGSYIAPRLWWIFQLLGHVECAILNGGYASWASEQQEVVDFAAASLGPATYSASFQPGFRLDFSDVLARAPATVLCNTLSEFPFSEASHPTPRSSTIGTIPGSVRLPYTQLLFGNPVPLIRRKFEVEAVFAAAGIHRGDSVIFFCADGYSATLGFFCSRLLGMRHAAVYDGSLEDWRARGGDCE